MSRQALPPKNHTHLLMVEGRDDEKAVAAFLVRRGYQWPDRSWFPRVQEFGGIDALLKALPVALKGPSRRLGVIVDADVDLDRRWAQLDGRFRDANLALPPAPEPLGTVITPPGGSPERVGVWLMPDNRTTGAIEDFLGRLVPSGDPVWRLAQEATQRAIELGASLKEGAASKGSIHAYLAWQERPGMPFGSAITSEVLSANAPAANDFLKWLRETFE